MGTSNTPPRPPVGQRSNEELLADLDVSLRNAVRAGRDAVYATRYAAHAVLLNTEKYAEEIALVKEVHKELISRSIDLKEFFVSFNQATGWLMDRFLGECLEYPHVTPHVRLLSGVRRDFICPLCAQHEHPVDDTGMRVCTPCLRRALEALHQKDEDLGVMVFRTYTASRRCAHADSETVMVTMFDEDWMFEPWCEQCITTEIQRRSE